VIEPDYGTAGIRRGGACFSVTVPLRRDIRAAIASITAAADQ